MRTPVDAPIDSARLFGTPEAPEGSFWLANVGDPVTAIADGTIISTGVDPANNESYVVQKLADGKYFAYLGLSDVSVLANVGVMEGSTLGKVAGNFEGILSDSPDAWLGQGNLQDPVAYIGLTAGDVTVIPTPTLDDPTATISVPASETAPVPVPIETADEAVPVEAPTPLADPAPVPAAPDEPTGEVVDSPPIADVLATATVTTPGWSLGQVTTTANPNPVTINITSSAAPADVASAVSAVLASPPTSFDNIVSSTPPSKGTSVSNVLPATTVEEVPVKGGIIGAVTSLPFWNDLGTRAINTFLQVGGGALGTGALGITHLSYKNALELGAASAVLSIITSLTRATSIKS